MPAVVVCRDALKELCVPCLFSLHTHPIVSSSHSSVSARSIGDSGPPVITIEPWKNAPELVRQESPIKDFLKTERNNAYGAAVRMGNDWKARRQIFGERMVLLPLMQTGTGAFE